MNLLRTCSDVRSADPSWAFAAPQDWLFARVVKRSMSNLIDHRRAYPAAAASQAGQETPGDPMSTVWVYFATDLRFVLAIALLIAALILIRKLS